MGIDPAAVGGGRTWGARGGGGGLGDPLRLQPLEEGGGALLGGGAHHIEDAPQLVRLGAPAEDGLAGAELGQ
eukprot:5833748-Pyramimonas_sp.AAC.1